MSSYEYHQILQFLYFEGYVDSYESAECLLESLDDDKFEDLCERATRPTRFPKSRERDIGHDDWKDSDPDNRDWDERPEGAKKLKRRLNAVVGTQKRQDIETGVRKEELNDKVIVAHYLFDEGYADSLNGAEVMAENISGQWANQILDEEYEDLTPEKEKKVKNRVGELARDIQVQGERMKDLKKKPFGKYRPKVKQEKEAIIKSARKKQKLVQNASDALIRTSTSRSASIQKRIQDLKDRS